MPFIFEVRRVYNRSKKYVRLRLTREEAETLLDALESWVEGSRDEAWSADDDVVGSLFGSMSDALSIRRKLWRKMS